ncbi:SDR family NAD(P)-dependent oxidoreductase [Alkalibacterium thalassium]|uniref:3-oxoacyl-[acyl-carrier protein] reductase n=1 Tax=Alkalibacterium thalassium TaxID=426701 RepID=A0A1G9EFM2_9LACT|nr:SDR family oxidoreductase [Alkalibacterium thalassium]SDK74906.1 3-oxoacyl-[acyl-carrier protein] reductase [Alkalibacterium thalassium]
MSIFSTEVFKGKHALVTGATGGIGYETAKGLSSMGADVTITGRKEDVLNDLKDEILNDFPDAKVNVAGADLADASNREKLVQSAENAFGPVSLLVISAGMTGGGVLEDLTQEELERVMHLNFTVPILLTQRLYDSMKKNKEGAVVNVSSLSGLRGTVGGTAYVGSKFALNGFTQSFALEAIEHNIRVNAVCPGFVDTKMGRDGIKSKGERHGNSFEEQLKIENESLPSGRISTPEDVANTILFLLTDAAENIVGEAVIISGGSLMR